MTDSLHAEWRQYSPSRVADIWQIHYRVSLSHTVWLVYHILYTGKRNLSKLQTSSILSTFWECNVFFNKWYNSKGEDNLFLFTSETLWHVKSLKLKFLCFLDSEHVCSIIAALFRNVTGSHHQRLVGKFSEGDHAKVDRLMELHFNYLKRVQACDDKIEREKQVSILSIILSLFLSRLCSTK